MVLEKIFCLLLLTFAYSLPTEREDLLCVLRDSCAGGVSSYTERNCRCDSDCAVYDDCCFDAANHHSLHKTSKSAFQCITVKTDSRIPDSFYMIADCPRLWDNDDIRKKCTSPDDKDFMQMLPITDNNDKLIYRNIFCALCHETNMDNFDPWELKLECPSFSFNNTKAAKEFLQFNTKAKRWIIKSKNGSSDHCKSTVKPSENSDVTLRTCYTNVTSKCAKNWKHHQTAKLCATDTAYRFLSGEDRMTIFKNKYCAKCNNVNLEELECMYVKYASPVSRDLGSYRGASLLNFAIIMNSLFVKNTATNCPPGLFLNPASHNCEELHCSQDTIKLNGMCVEV